MKESVKIVTTTAVFEEGYPADKAIERLSGLGFEALDMALDYWTHSPESPFLQDDYLTWAENLRLLAEDKGMPYTHSHAPGEAGTNPIIGRSVKCAGTLGAKFTVVHPVWRVNWEIIEDAEEFIKINTEAIKPWLETAESSGVTILSENLLWGASKDPKIIAELVKSVGSDNFGWCYDTGHANIFGYKPDILKECVAVPLSLHMQDNSGKGDEHLIPGDGTVDWDLLVSTLKDIGYPGDCVLEAHHQSLDTPDSERDAVLTRLLDSAKVLREKMTR